MLSHFLSIDTHELNTVFSITAPIVAALIGLISTCIACIGNYNYYVNVVKMFVLFQVKRNFANKSHVM